jgi:ferredoxin
LEAEYPNMRVVVDLELCGGHGTCEREAPEIFRVVDPPDGYAHAEVLLEQLPEELRARAKIAERQCPNGAIKLIED